MKARFLVLVAIIALSLPLVCNAEIVREGGQDDNSHEKGFKLYAGYPLCSDVIAKVNDICSKAYLDAFKEDGMDDKLEKRLASCVESGMPYILKDYIPNPAIDWERMLKEKMSECAEDDCARWTDYYVEGNTKTLVLYHKAKLAGFWNNEPVLKSELIEDDSGNRHLNVKPQDIVARPVSVKDLIYSYNSRARYILSSTDHIFKENEEYRTDCWASLDGVSVKKRSKGIPLERMHSLTIYDEGGWTSGGMIALLGLPGVKVLTVFMKDGHAWEDITAEWVGLDEFPSAQNLVFVNSLNNSYTKSYVNSALVIDPKYYDDNKTYHLDIPETYAFYAGENEKYKILVATGFNEKAAATDVSVSTPDGSEMVP